MGWTNHVWLLQSIPESCSCWCCHRFVTGFSHFHHGRSCHFQHLGGHLSGNRSWYSRHSNIGSWFRLRYVPGSNFTITFPSNLVNTILLHALYAGPRRRGIGLNLKLKKKNDYFHENSLLFSQFQFALVEIFLTCFYDKFNELRRYKALLTAGACVGLFLLGLPAVTEVFFQTWISLSFKFPATCLIGRKLRDRFDGHIRWWHRRFLGGYFWNGRHYVGLWCPKRGQRFPIYARIPTELVLENLLGFISVPALGNWQIK